MKQNDKSTAANERFGVMAAVTRRNGSENLKVCTPQEVQCKPPLRQAASTLSVIGGTCAVPKYVDSIFDNTYKQWS